MPIYKEHLSIGSYEFIEIEADTLEDLIARREAYLATKKATSDPDQVNRELGELASSQSQSGPDISF